MWAQLYAHLPKAMRPLRAWGKQIQRLLLPRPRLRRLLSARQLHDAMHVGMVVGEAHRERLGVEHHEQLVRAPRSRAARAPNQAHAAEPHPAAGEAVRSGAVVAGVAGCRRGGAPQVLQQQPRGLRVR